MLPEGFKIPAEEDEITPGFSYPVGIGICIKWIARPALIREAIAHIIAQPKVAREQVRAILSFALGRQPFWRAPAASNDARCFDAGRVRHFIAVAIEMGWFAPLQDPISTIHQRAAKTGSIKGVIDRDGHTHFGGVSYRGPFAKNTFDLAGHPTHAHYKGREIQEKEKAVIWLDADNFHIFLGHQLAEKIEQNGVPVCSLAQEREGKANREAHTLAHEIEKHASGRIVAI